MGENKYIFDRLDMALYKEGLKASDYIPKHGMIICYYEEDDVNLQLIVYAPDYAKKGSRFAWAWYVADGEGSYDLDDVELAVFDETKGEFDQELPSKKQLGMMVFQKLTGLEF